jgi:ribosomal protein L16 Arg81 hydroxylase
VDEDLIDSEYYASPEVMKWFVETYPFIKDKPDQKPMECILEAGEVIFVPSGWWHQVC